MAPLNTESNLAAPDDFYERLIATHRGLSDEESSLVNAKLVLLLANHIGDPDVLVVGLRISGAATAPSAPPRPRTSAPRSRRVRTPLATASVVFDGKSRKTALHDRESLAVGAHVAGPAIVVEYSSTTVVAPNWSAAVDADGNLRMVPR